MSAHNPEVSRGRVARTQACSTKDCGRRVHMHYVSEGKTRRLSLVRPHASHFLNGNCANGHRNSVAVTRNLHFRCQNATPSGGPDGLRGKCSGNLLLWHETDGHLTQQCSTCNVAITTPYSCMHPECSSPALSLSSRAAGLRPNGRLVVGCQTDVTRRLVEAGGRAPRPPVGPEDHPVYKMVIITNSSDMTAPNPLCDVLTNATPVLFTPSAVASAAYKCPACGHQNLMTWSSSSSLLTIIKCATCALIFRRIMH